MRDVLRSGMGARLQPLEIIITTAGFKRPCPCYEEREYAIKILQGVMQNDSYHAFIATLDKDDDPFDPKNWKKANPNLGVSLSIKDFEDMALEAKGKSSALNNFLVKRLNIWTSQKVMWIPYDKWDASAGGEPLRLEDLKGRVAYGGLDLSSTTDLTALVLVLPKEGGGFDVFCRFFMPSDTLEERSRQDKVPYAEWVRDGLIIATPGNVVDYDYVEQVILELAEIVDLKEVAYDRFNATQIVINLRNKGINVLPFGQGFVSMNAPTKMIETLVLSKKLHHRSNKVLNWMCSNVELVSDPAGNIKMTKPSPQSIERIDGMVALAMSFGAYLADTEIEESSPYEERGVLFL